MEVSPQSQATIPQMLPQATQCTKEGFLSNNLPTLPWKNCHHSQRNWGPWLCLWLFALQCGTKEKSQCVAYVTGNSRRFIIWNSRQILESRSDCLLMRRGKTPTAAANLTQGKTLCWPQCWQFPLCRRTRCTNWAWQEGCCCHSYQHTQHLASSCG